MNVFTIVTDFEKPNTWNRIYWETNHDWVANRRPGSVDKYELLLGNDRYGREILFWDNYGIVNPSTVTTNGSLHTLYSLSVRYPSWTYEELPSRQSVLEGNG